ncbi:MAG: hypothetical protein IKX79_03535 [Desulfovibrionaceae bacterium]|nr:hypothetical protein [Desulfovibrionaceae bacterium]
MLHVTLPRCLRHLLITLLFAALSGCAAQTPPPPIAPLSSVRVGIASAVQPPGTTDLLAGYIPEKRDLASPDALLHFDSAVLDQTRSQADPARTIVPIPAPKGVNPSAQRSPGNNSALHHWVNIGAKAGVDLIIVPQILTWHEREGGTAGVVSSAEVDIQFYLIDVKDETLLARSVFRDKQESLANNLLKAPTFFKRGGKWITAQQLAEEGIDRMIKEFGL